MIQNGQVAEVVVTYADRLTRFGLDYLTLFFAGYDVRFTVLHPNDGKTPEQELTDDLITILASFLTAECCNQDASFTNPLYFL